MGQGTLKLRSHPGGLRHYLDDKPVKTGVVLELLLPDERWLPGSFVDVRTRPPMLLITLGGTSEGKDAAEGILQLPPSAILRWPEPAE